jgi:hypothetical protein
MMLALVMSLSLSTSPASPPPPSASLLGTLPVRQGLLVESLGVSGSTIGRGVGNIIGGAILGVLGIGGVVGGILCLGAAQIADGSSQKTLTIVGWTVLGVGALFTIISIPLIIVGIVRVVKGSLPGGGGRAGLGLGVTQKGEFAVTF